MKTSTKTISLAAALTAGLTAAFAIAPAGAQEAETIVTRTAGPVGHQMRGGPAMGTIAVHRLGGGIGEEMMATFDADGDGIVTQDEIDAVRLAELAEFDADGDGTLSLEEYQALWLSHVYERMVDAFQELDADGDGQVTDEEFNAAFANVVARLDQNEDGGLSADDRPDFDREMLRQGQGPNMRIFVMPGMGGPGR